MSADRCREISPLLKKRLFWEHSIAPAVCALIAWVLYLAKVTFGFDLVAMLKGRTKDPSFDPTMLYLILAIIVTFIAPMITVIQIRKTLALARNGVEVVATITSVGRFAVHGFVKVECQYRYAGNWHALAWSHAKAVSTVSEGDSVAVIVDPANPKRCMRKDEVFPERGQDGQQGTAAE